MASFPYILFIFIVVFGCCLLIFDYTGDRKEYASRSGIIDILKRQPNGKVQVNDYLSVKLYGNHIIINLNDEDGVVREIQRVTRKKSESDFIYHPWRKPIIRKMKQINKEEKEEQQLEQQNIKEDLKHKKNKKKKRKQYYQELKEENRKNHEKYADYYKRL